MAGLWLALPGCASLDTMRARACAPTVAVFSFRRGVSKLTAGAGLNHHLAAAVLAAFIAHRLLIADNHVQTARAL